MAGSVRTKREAAQRDAAVNRQAFHEYAVEERLEAGIALTGTEIKSIRAGRANLRDGFVRVGGGEAWLENVHIAPYEHGNRMNHEPKRARKLLLHRDEIAHLAGQTAQKGRTIVPLRLYYRNGYAKVEIGVARGKRQYEKREAIAARDAQREMAQARAAYARR